MNSRKNTRISESFGPESFVTSVAGLVCISLPYTFSAAREAWWLVILPLVAGVALVMISNSVGNARSSTLKRSGVGFLVAFAGFVLSLIGILAAIAVISVFRH